MRKPVPTYDLYGESRSERPDFWLHCETIASRSSVHRWEIGLHRHDTFQQFLYIRKGSGDALLENETVQLRPPCVVALPPGCRHGFRFSRDVDGLIITLVADRLMHGAGLAAGLMDWLARPRVIRLDQGADADYLDTTLLRLLSEFEARRSGTNALMAAYLNAIVVLLGRTVANEGKGEERSPASVTTERLDDLIAEHFRRQLTAQAYADLLAISPTHLNRVVKTVTGMTVHDRIMLRVIEEARRALIFTSSTVQDVAEELGFSDAAYFSRCFRQRTGRTPSHYRDEERARLGTAA